jgi:AcrR family transcriptional regulator
MARGRAAGYDDQRVKILAAAARLFARRGYSATSMNEVAEACGLSKATLYHYYRDKHTLLASIADEHVSKLQALVQDVSRQGSTPDEHMRELIRRIAREYASAQDEHRVLTEDVKFLLPEDQARVLGKQREVVAGFAHVVGQLRPELDAAALTKPLTMLLFGMINWLFTWMKPHGELDYDTMAPIVADLFLNGLNGVKAPAAAPATT